MIVALNCLDPTFISPPSRRGFSRICGVLADHRFCRLPNDKRKFEADALCNTLLVWGLCKTPVHETERGLRTSSRSGVLTI
jgi:hypothetical protein